MNFLKQNINSNAFMKCWLVFVLGFLALQYPIPVCLLLGLAGGLAGGALARWWGLVAPLDMVQVDAKPRMPQAVEAFRKRLQSLGWERRFRNRPGRPRPRLFSQPRPRKERRSRRRQEADNQPQE